MLQSSTQQQRRQQLQQVKISLQQDLNYQRKQLKQKDFVNNYNDKYDICGCYKNNCLNKCGLKENKNNSNSNNNKTILYNFNNIKRRQ